MEMSLVPLVCGVLAALIIAISLIILAVCKLRPRRRQASSSHHPDSDSQISSFTQEEQLKPESSLFETESNKGASSPDIIPGGESP